MELLQRAAELMLSFSALQRAENSSISVVTWRVAKTERFQCSSASRKFLNGGGNLTLSIGTGVSVLFSEPKIPQFRGRFGARHRRDAVSVLFSEPKIPQ